MGLRVHLRWHGDDQLRALVPQLRDAHRVQVGEDRARDGLLRAHRRQEVQLEGVALRSDSRRRHRALHPRRCRVVPRVPALCVDAITANFEEKNFFRCENPSTTQEVLCFASLIGTFYGLIPFIASGGYKAAIAHSMQYTQVVPMIMGFSVLGYSSVSFILSLIKYYGATEAEIIKSLRKVLSIVISFILFPKALNWKYIAGFIAVLVSTAYTFYLKGEKAKAKEAAKAAEASA